jgi:hypothetical protein
MRNLKFLCIPIFTVVVNIIIFHIFAFENEQYFFLQKEEDRTSKQTMMDQQQQHNDHGGGDDDDYQEQESSSEETSTRNTPTLYLAFNDTNPHNANLKEGETSFCPYATCHNSPICAPCNQRFIFIAATARSGSTSLLYMINSLPNVRLSGENFGELNVASLVESNLMSRKHFGGGEAKEGAFIHNAIPEQALACPIQHIFKTINPPNMDTMMQVNRSTSVSLFDPSVILGVKTIRLFGPKAVKLTPKEASDFFKRNFPCSKVIVNIRSNVTAQVVSKEKLNWRISSSYEDIAKHNQQLIEFAQWLGPEMGKLIQMEDWTTNVTVMNQVVEWAGFKECAFNAILHENDNGFKRDHETRPSLGPRCRAP